MTPIGIAKESGRKAFQSAKFYKAGNPYKKDTQLHREYEHAFNQAWFENLEKLEEKGQ